MDVIPPIAVMASVDEVKPLAGLEPSVKIVPLSEVESLEDVGSLEDMEPLDGAEPLNEVLLMGKSEFLDEADPLDEAALLAENDEAPMVVEDAPLSAFVEALDKGVPVGGKLLSLLRDERVPPNVEDEPVN